MCGPDRILIGKCDSKVCARSVPGSFPHCNSGRKDVANVRCGLHTRWEMRFHGLCPERSPIVILARRCSCVIARSVVTLCFASFGC